MNDEKTTKDCKTCSCYADFAYFCLAKKEWKFPEDYNQCEKYIEGSLMDKIKEEKCIQVQ